MTWVNVGVAAVETGYSMYSANKAKQDAKSASKLTGQHGVSGDFGQSTVDGEGNMHFSLNPEDQQFGDLARKLGMGSLDRYQANPMDALDPSQARAGGNEDAALAHQEGQAGNLSDNFYKTFKNFDPQSAANDRYNLLTKQAAPGESLQRNSLQSKLMAQGRLGTSGGGVDTKALYDAQDQADLGRQVAGQDYGMQWQKQLGDMFSNFSGMATNSGAQRYNLANSMVQGGQANDMFSMNSAGSMQSLYQQLFAPMFAAQKLTQSQSDRGVGGVQQANKDSSDAMSNMLGTAVKMYMGSGGGGGMTGAGAGGIG